MDDLLALEPLLIERLGASVQVPRLKVLGAADLEGVEEQSQHTPALHVLYRGYRPTTEKGNGVIQQIEQTWLVVVVVRNVRDAHSGAGVRAAAGPIMHAVCAALLGWPRQHADFSPLRLASAPAAWFGKGVGYFPLAFTTNLHARGEP